MPNKPIPSEVVRGIAELVKDTAIEAVHQAAGGLLPANTPSKPNANTTAYSDEQKQLKELVKQEKAQKSYGIPSLRSMLDQQEAQDKIIKEQAEKKKGKELEDLKSRQKQEALRMQQQQSSVNALAATGSTQHAPKPFARTSKEQLTQSDR